MPNDPRATLDLPLAEIIRPTSLKQYIGQHHLLNWTNGEIANFLKLGYLPSMVLCGPPGVGKTTLAALLAEHANCVFAELSATDSTIADLRELSGGTIDENRKRTARGERRLRVVVFIDEIHRFSTVQQDYLLPFVELGVFVFIGATTVDPKKRIRRAILSRCQLFRLEPAGAEELRAVVRRAQLHENIRRKIQSGLPFFALDERAVDHIVDFASGDMRKAIRLVELVSSNCFSGESDPIQIGTNRVLEAMSAMSRTLLGQKLEDSSVLVRRLLKTLERAQRRRFLPQKASTPRVNGSSETPAEPGNSDSDLESVFNELTSRRHETQQENDWEGKFAFSDGSDVEPGFIYSDTEDISSGTLPQAALKRLILIATQTCLKLLENGESPEFILKQLIQFKCNSTEPTQELVNLVATLKTVKNASVDPKLLLSHCIERFALAFTKSLPLRPQLEASRRHCSARVAETTKEHVDFDITFDESLLETLSNPPSSIVESFVAHHTIVGVDELSPGFSLGTELHEQCRDVSGQF